jgi:hypothetical protein
MITKTSVQMRLCSAIKAIGRFDSDFRNKLKVAEFSYISGDLQKADALLSELGIEAPVSAHAKTMPNNGELRASIGQALQMMGSGSNMSLGSSDSRFSGMTPRTPPFPFIPFKAPCAEDHEPYQARGGICQKCRRTFFRGTDIQ